MSAPDSRPMIVAARRTPVATMGRALAGVDAAHLAAPVLAALRDDLSSSGSGQGQSPGRAPAPAQIDDVVLGNCCGPGGDVARIAALAGGLGIGTPAVTVDRQCGAGLEAIRLACALVGSGTAELVLAGGTESASQASGERARFAPDGFADPEMGAAADAVAEAVGISRERQDAYSARSHARAVASAAAGWFDAELVPAAGLSADDRPRPGLSQATLARFRPAFTSGGTVTVGNSCGINDGAAAVAVIGATRAAELGLPGLRVLGTAVAGIDPALPGLGPVPAIRAVCERTGVSLAQVDVLEITEAFAAQVLAATDTLGLDALGADAHRICPQGGAIALGHPWGASGALLMVRLFSSMVRLTRQPGPGPSGSPTPRYGVAACAIGGGQGIAVLVEAVPGRPVAQGGAQ